MSSSHNNNVREPSEIEAWKHMMDSMIKFISASTKLMKTITSRAEVSASPIASTECEVECIMCPTRSPKQCGVCAAIISTTGQGDRPPNVPGKVSTNAPSTLQSQHTEQQVGAPTEPSNEEAKNEEEEKVQEVVEEGNVEGENVAEGNVAEDNVPEGNVVEENAAEGNAEEEKVEEVKVEFENKIKDKPSSPTQPTEIRKEAGDKNYCVCKEVRKIKNEAAKAGVQAEQKSCVCPKKCGKSGAAPDKGEDGNALCACDIGPAEKEEMTRDLASKLHEAQENLSKLQQEMSRLQCIETNKNSQSAALYKEIMKDSSLDKQTTNVSSGTGPVEWLPQQVLKSKTCTPLRKAMTARKQLCYDEEPSVYPIEQRPQAPGPGEFAIYDPAPAGAGNFGGISPAYPPLHSTANYPGYHEPVQHKSGCNAVCSQPGGKPPTFQTLSNSAAASAYTPSATSTPQRSPMYQPMGSATEASVYSQSNTTSSSRSPMYQPVIITTEASVYAQPGSPSPQRQPAYQSLGGSPEATAYSQSGQSPQRQPMYQSLGSKTEGSMYTQGAAQCSPRCTTYQTLSQSAVSNPYQPSRYQQSLGMSQEQRWQDFQTSGPQPSSYRPQMTPPSSQGQRIRAPPYSSQMSPQNAFVYERPDLCSEACYSSVTGQPSIRPNENVYYDNCMGLGYVEDGPNEDDYVNAEFISDSQPEFVDDGCYDDTCDGECYA